MISWKHLCNLCNLITELVHKFIIMSDFASGKYATRLPNCSVIRQMLLLKIASIPSRMLKFDNCGRPGDNTTRSNYSCCLRDSKHFYCQRSRRPATLYSTAAARCSIVLLCKQLGNWGKFVESIALCYLMKLSCCETNSRTSRLCLICSLLETCHSFSILLSLDSWRQFYFHALIT